MKLKNLLEKENSEKVTEEAGMSSGVSPTGSPGVISGPSDSIKNGILGPDNFFIPTRIGDIRKRLLSKYDKKD